MWAVHLVLVGILPEDVPDDDDGLLHHVVHLGLDKLDQHIDTSARSRRSHQVIIKQFFNRSAKLDENVDTIARSRISQQMSHTWFMI